MRRLLISSTVGVASYFAGLFCTLALLPLMSGNTHDGSVEAAMTGAFISGPISALAGLAVSFLTVKKRS